MESLNWGKPIQTVSGKPAELLRKLHGNRAPYAVLVLSNGAEHVQHCYASGMHAEGQNACENIVNVPPKKIEMEFWINVYPAKDGGSGHRYEIYRSYLVADEMAEENIVACVKMVGQAIEGQFDSNE